MTFALAITRSNNRSHRDPGSTPRCNRPDRSARLEQEVGLENQRWANPFVDGIRLVVSLVLIEGVYPWNPLTRFI